MRPWSAWSCTVAASTPSPTTSRCIGSPTAGRSCPRPSRPIPHPAAEGMAAMSTAPTPELSPEAAASQLLTQVATGHILASALQVVVRLDIPGRLADGPRTAAELAAATGVQEDALYRVLRALAAAGIFDEAPRRRFALGLAGQALRAGVPGGMRDMALWITSPFHFRVYAELMHSVRSGQPAAEKVTGMPVFEYFPRDKELS